MGNSPKMESASLWQPRAGADSRRALPQGFVSGVSPLGLEAAPLGQHPSRAYPTLQFLPHMDGSWAISCSLNQCHVGVTFCHFLSLVSGCSEEKLSSSGKVQQLLSSADSCGSQGLRVPLAECLGAAVMPITSAGYKEGLKWMSTEIPESHVTNLYIKIKRFPLPQTKNFSK